MARVHNFPMSSMDVCYGLNRSFLNPSLQFLLNRILPFLLDRSSQFPYEFNGSLLEFNRRFRRCLIERLAGVELCNEVGGHGARRFHLPLHWCVPLSLS